MNFSKKIIIALDFADGATALSWVDQLLPMVDTFKVGLELFTKEGPSIVREIHKRGGKVFLDLKLHDIPNTVASACASLSSLNVFMLNIHCSGGLEMMKAAQKTLIETKSKSLLVGVTVLTSLSESDLQEVGITASPHHLVLKQSLLAKDAGLLVEAPTNHNFANIPDVPKEYGVAIYDAPGAKATSEQQNLYITNNKSKPIAFRFEYKDDKLKVSAVELN